MSTTPAGFDFDALAEWAESDEATHTPQTSPVFRGEDAARASRAFLGRGRPTRLPRLRGGEPFRMLDRSELISSSPSTRG